jgi:membrane protease subunit HflK
MIQQAEAYREQVVARATGDASRFTAVWQEYSNAREVTARRIYLETMEDVLRDMNKLVIDQQASGSGVVPYLPLPMLERGQMPQSGSSQSPSAGGVMSGFNPVAAERN